MELSWLGGNRRIIVWHIVRYTALGKTEPEWQVFQVGAFWLLFVYTPGDFNVLEATRYFLQLWDVKSVLWEAWLHDV